MRGVCRSNSSDGVVHAVLADYEGVRVNRDSAKWASTAWNKLVIRSCDNVVGNVEFCFQ